MIMAKKSRNKIEPKVNPKADKIKKKVVGNKQAILADAYVSADPIGDSKKAIIDLFGKSLFTESPLLYSHLIIVFEMTFPILIKKLEEEYSSTENQEAIIQIVERLNLKFKRWIDAKRSEQPLVFKWPDERIWSPFNSKQRLHIKEIFSSDKTEKIFFKIWDKLHLDGKYMKEKTWVEDIYLFSAFIAVLDEQSLLSTKLNFDDLHKGLIAIFFKKPIKATTVSQYFAKRNTEETKVFESKPLFSWINKLIVD